MKKNGSLCQVEQLPCPCPQEQNGSACWTQSHAHNSWTGAATTPVRNRTNGAVGALCSGRDCGVSRAEGAELGRRGTAKILVTGGAGYFGFRLGRALASRGESVILLDLQKPPWAIPSGAVFYQSDIRDYNSLSKVCAGVDCVFHTASYGMSGPEQLKKEQVESVNVGGTNNVINVCLEQGISRLIYTSTVNVAFAGKPIEDGDEDTVPCVPLDMHIDHYSRTKAIADRMVLSANGRSVKGGGILRTCVLRPSGIYGPEERRHLHRVMVNVERRLFSFSFGDPGARMNWVHVDNLVLAHVLAAEGLTPERSCVASGQAYFINDGESVNVFEWLTPLFERLGYSRPLIHLPVSLVYSAAILMECLHVALRPIVEIPLLFTRNEVRNIAVSHTFKIEKARQDLGFNPKKYSLADSVDQYLQSRPPRTKSSHLTKDHLLPLLLLLLLGMVTVLLCFSWRGC
ncbi:putative short-chain dehydrogenase/reductase family 42E member 2 [Chanos chanos]|uniref:Short-chain dehydrogenase/reductase family 42E member 2 n=1 Tax=Chanos chanos TaxID=29144 RepID=A0A6J2WMN2_CHACN|nr:putative short-chain dehydrogenase/reductase family 42E member 2 [Chanos chanos]